VSSFQGANNTYLYEVGTWSSVLIREVSSFQGCRLRGVPLYIFSNTIYTVGLDLLFIALGPMIISIGK